MTTTMRLWLDREPEAGNRQHFPSHPLTIPWCSSKPDGARGRPAGRSIRQWVQFFSRKVMNDERAKDGIARSSVSGPINLASLCSVSEALPRWVAEACTVMAESSGYSSPTCEFLWACDSDEMKRRWFVSNDLAVRLYGSMATLTNPGGSYNYVSKEVEIPPLQTSGTAASCAKRLAGSTCGDKSGR